MQLRNTGHAATRSVEQVTDCPDCGGDGCRARLTRRGREQGRDCETCDGYGTLCATCDEPCHRDEACGPCAERALDAMGLDIACVALSPSDGRRIRCATPAETLAYVTRNCTPTHPAFRKPVRVGAVLVDEDTGPGQWFGGAGF